MAVLAEEAVPAAPLIRGWIVRHWAGLALAAAVAAVAMWLAALPWSRHGGLGALTLAIVLGMVIGNTWFPRMAAHAGVGVDFSKSVLLRTGIVLYGFRITFQQIGEVGWSGAAIGVLMVASTFMLAMQVGTRVLRMDRDTAMLVGAGSAICGAAAAMAVESVLGSRSHKASMAVATVVVFGTLGMFVYPLLYPWLGLSAHAYGVYAGSSLHEVAQVVVAGQAVGADAAAAAVIEKMLRVMLLAPFLLLLSSWLAWTRRRCADRARAHGGGIVVPWFSLLFIAASALNSSALLPEAWVRAIVDTDTALLAMAMAALGLRTQAGAIGRAGAKPLLLAAILFGFLLVGGYAVNLGVARLFAAFA